MLNRDIVLEGVGIGLLRTTLVDQHIWTGRLARLLEDFEISDDAAEIRWAYIGRALLPAKVRAFIDHCSGFSETGMQ